MALQQYIDDTRDLLHDQRGGFWSDKQIIRYVNLARQQTAALSGCIRILIPGQAPFGGGSVPGTMVPGAITPGMPATNSFQTIARTEKYSYEFANAYLRNFNQNLKCISDVISVSVSWGGSRPSLDWMPWDDLQAYARSYNILVTSDPRYWSTYGDGQNGQVWLFPVPVNNLEMEWDCFAVPADIFDDSAYEALPASFRTYVPFYAAHLAYLNSQRSGQANVMLELYYSNSGIARVAADRGKTSSYYR